MAKQQFYQQMQEEIARLDDLGVSKRREHIIESFHGTKAVIDGREYVVFNSNDYLGLRHDEQLKKAEHSSTLKYGSGPGAVRFISGSLGIYTELEKKLAEFHGRESAMVFSSAFATNVAVLFSLIKGQVKGSIISDKVLVVSDELNHRSIIEGIRVGNLPSEQRVVYPHLNYDALEKTLSDNVGKFERVVVVSDGVFSMLGEIADIGKLQSICEEFDREYPLGVMLVIDDSHGVASAGKTGRGSEEDTRGKADVLVGTLGKGFGADGGYVIGSKLLIEYLRESCATYIYSNPMSPGTAGAGLAGVELVMSQDGENLLKQLHHNIELFKAAAKKHQLTLAADSHHAIQPLLIGDAKKAKMLAEKLFTKGYWVTPITYPVVAAGRDEIRIQLSARHTRDEIEGLVEEIGNEL